MDGTTQVDGNLSAADPLHEGNPPTVTDAVACELTGEHRRRAQMADLVLGLWRAARRDELAEYLRPIPITRLYSAERAFLEIGALAAVHVLRWGVFRLKRDGSVRSMAPTAGEITKMLVACPDDIDRLVEVYLRHTGAI